MMEPWFYWAERISYLGILPTITVFGLFGNIGILLVYLGNKNERNRTISIVLSYVAVCDILQLIFSFWVFVISKHFFVGVEAVPYAFALGQICSTLSVWLDCFITFERYLAVCSPMKHKNWCGGLKTTINVLATITLFAILFELPRFFELNIGWILHCEGKWDWRTEPMPLRDTSLYKYGKLLIAYGFFNFVGPFCWLTAFNLKIWLEIRRAREFRRKASNLNTDFNHLQIPDQNLRSSHLSTVKC